MGFLLNQQSKKSLLENFGEEKILQSILRSETLISNHKKRHKLSSEGKYTTLTFKALKTRYIALKIDTKKQGQNVLAFLLLFQSRKRRSIGSFKTLANFKAVSTDGIVLLFSIKPIICLEVFIFLANSSCVNPSLTLNCFILF